MYVIALWLALSVVALTTSPIDDSPSILIRHDRPDSAYVALGERYADVLAHVEERAEGTVLAPQWVLTAAHVVESSGPFDRPYVTVKGERYEVEKIIIHPKWEGGWDDILSNHDVALLKLSRPVPDVRPVSLYRQTDEHGKVLTFVGRGRTGTGETGPVGEKSDIVRGATNRVEGASPTVLIFNFDIGPEATELEGLPGSGDSGSPALLERNDTLFVVGVGSAGTGFNGYSAYGTMDLYARVSAHADWIDTTIARDPGPTTDWSDPVAVGPELLEWPDSPAGSLARSFFSTYSASLSTDSPEPWTAFYETHGQHDERSPAARGRILFQALVQSLGPIEINAYSVSGPGQIQVLFYSPRIDDWRSIGLGASNDDPPLLTRLFMKVESEDDRLPRGR